MNSATSTDPKPASDAGFRAWQFFLMVSMLGATIAVVLAENTHPAALLLLSAAVVAAGMAGLALHGALAGFAGRSSAEAAPAGGAARTALEHEKAQVLRAIKELQFDHAMGKMADADYRDLDARLRARAVSLMEALAETPAPAPPRTAGPGTGTCVACGTPNDSDARFCKRCGGRLS